jgi:hypothetical protein
VPCKICKVFSKVSVGDAVLAQKKMQNKEVASVPHLGKTEKWKLLKLGVHVKAANVPEWTQKKQGKHMGMRA